MLLWWKLVALLFVAMIVFLKKLRRRLLIFLALPPTMLWLWLEKKYRLVKLDFPRDVDELLQSGDFFCRVFKLAPGWKVENITRFGRKTEAETKNEHMVGLRLTFSKDGEKHKLERKVFCKLQAASIQFPPWITALKAIMEPGIFGEADFYANAAADAPIRVPKVYYAKKSILANRVCLVLEHFDLGQDTKMYADYSRVPIDIFELMIKKMAVLHEHYYVGTVQFNNILEWVRPKSVLGVGGGTLAALMMERVMTKSTRPVFNIKLWEFLKSELERNSAAGNDFTMIHGDFRPGNIFFRGGSGTANELIMTDWEGTKVGNPIWDFVYCTTLGLCASDRRLHQMRLLDECYLPGLSTGREASLFGSRKGLSLRETKKAVIDLFTVYIGVLGTVMMEVRKNMKSAGITKERKSWEIRLAFALSDVDPTLSSSPLFTGVVESGHQSVARLCQTHGMTEEQLLEM